MIDIIEKADQSIHDFLEHDVHVEVASNPEFLAQGMSYGARIGSKSFNAGIGYGGFYFPKDIKALKYLAAQNGYRLRTVEATVDVNAAQKTWFFKKTSDPFIIFDGLKGAVQGLTINPCTDDLRETPSLENVPLLLER